jgi:hypothetical protein
MLQFGIQARNLSIAFNEVQNVGKKDCYRKSDLYTYLYSRHEVVIEKHAGTLFS